MTRFVRSSSAACAMALLAACACGTARAGDVPAARIDSLGARVRTLASGVVPPAVVAHIGVVPLHRPDVAPPPAPPPAARAVRPVAPPRPARTAGVTPGWAAELRTRAEATSANDLRLPGAFGRDAAAEPRVAAGAVASRLRGGIARTLAPGIRAALVLQDVRSTGGVIEPGETVNTLDVHEAWLEFDSLDAQPVDLRIGRVPLALGDGRVLGRDDWSATGTRTDGARVRWAQGGRRADAFLAWLRGGPAGLLVGGIDVAWRVRGAACEAYHVERACGDSAWTAGSGARGDLLDGTSGAHVRFAGRVGELDLGSAVQLGRRAGDAVRASLVSVRCARTLPLRGMPRVWLEHVHATGDDDPADGRYQRFEPIAPDRHEHASAIGVAGAGNFVEWAAGAGGRVAPGWTVRAELHAFRLARATDAWVDAAGRAVRFAAGGAAGSALGRELDLGFEWAAGSEVRLCGGTSHFRGGGFVTTTGGGGDVDRGWLQLTVAR